MLNQAQVMIKVSPLTVADFVDLLYSPALLLESRFDASITDDPEFRASCEWGFNAYFELMWEPNALGDDFVFVTKLYTSAEVVASVVRDVWPEKKAMWLVPSLPWRAGYALGWLSALSLIQLREAGEGLAVLTVLVSQIEGHQALVA